MSTENSHIGVGLYSIADAARITGVHPSSVARWIDPDSGVIRRVIDWSEHTLTFRELMEIQFVRIFRAEGVSLQALRTIHQRAAARYQTDYPFSAKRFDTDGKTLFATMIKEHGRGRLLEDLRQGQLVFEPFIRPLFRKLDYRGAREIARYWPLERARGLVLDPLRKFGQPIDSFTGVATRAIFEATQAGGGQDWKTVAEWLDIPISAVEAAVTFEQRQAA